MGMRPIKLVVIGLGLMGRRHAEIAAASAACDLVGACDVNPRMREIAERYGAPFFQNAGRMLDLMQPDGAIIATESAQHLAVFEECSLRGVHALIEKPVADTIDAALRIAEVSDRTGTQVLVGHHRRHNPLIAETRAIVNGGQIGDLRAVSVMWALMKPREYFDTAWRTLRPDGGPVLINLVHELDILRYVCGEIDQVFAQCRSDARGFEVEDSASVSLTFHGGAVGTLLACDAAAAPWSYEATTKENPLYFHAPESCYYFMGASGSLAFPRMELWRYSDPARIGWQHPIEKTVRRVQAADSLVNQLDHFCQVARGAVLPLVDARDGARSLAAALAVLQSNGTNAPQRPSIDAADA